MFPTLRRLLMTSPKPSPATTRPLRPVVAVIGTTGVGKSQLAVSLAQSLRSSGRSSPRTLIHPAVILSADSMQLYKGLDVITNKVTAEEMGGVPHWGLDVVDVGEGGSWDVGRWCNGANKLIGRLPNETLPIICGGTHYFVQHFLFPPPELSFDRPPSPAAAPPSGKGKGMALRWTPPGPLPPVPEGMDEELKGLLETFWTNEPAWPPGSIDPSDPSSSSTPAPVTPAPTSSRPISSSETHALSLHRVLEAVDPKEAGRWHWRDERKVRRGLERWWERGGGEVESTSVGGTAGRGESAEEGAAEAKGRQARFRTLIFWVYEPLETLRPRLDKRVDKMLENGLLDEITEMREIAREIYGSADAVDHTEGIFQSIGYRQFADLPLPHPFATRHPLFPSMLARTKISTHQYAKSQLQWIKKQLLPAVREARSLGGEVEVYVVPGGERGVPGAVEAMGRFLEGGEMPGREEVGVGLGEEEIRGLLACLEVGEANKVPDTAERQELNARRVCEACSTEAQPFSVLVKEWDQHKKSKLHKRNTSFVRHNKDEWIAKKRADGLAKKAEREQKKAETEADKAAAAASTTADS
ncbi:hypothetical protein IAT38_002904 [Cryptococcus sp. DSM 104549]